MHAQKNAKGITVIIILGNVVTMKLDYFTPAQVITIWQPRYHDKTVLIAKYKVGTHNIIKITKSKSHNGEYYLSGKTITKYPLESNGKIQVYAVPIDEMQVYEGRNKNEQTSTKESRYSQIAEFGS